MRIYQTLRSANATTPPPSTTTTNDQNLDHVHDTYFSAKKSRRKNIVC